MSRNISALVKKWRTLTPTQQWNVEAAINGSRADLLRIGQNVDGHDLAKEILRAAAEPEHANKWWRRWRALHEAAREMVDRIHASDMVMNPDGYTDGPMTRAAYDKLLLALRDDQ